MMKLEEEKRRGKTKKTYMMQDLVKYHIFFFVIFITKPLSLSNNNQYPKCMTLHY